MDLSVRNRTTQDAIGDDDKKIVVNTKHQEEIQKKQDIFYEIPEDSVYSAMFNEFANSIHKEILDHFKDAEPDCEKISKLLGVLDHSLRTYTNLALFNKINYKISN